MDDTILPNALDAGDKYADVICGNAALEYLEDVEDSANDVSGIGAHKSKLFSSIVSVEVGNC